MNDKKITERVISVWNGIATLILLIGIISLVFYYLCFYRDISAVFSTLIIPGILLILYCAFFRVLRSKRKSKAQSKKYIFTSYIFIALSVVIGLVAWSATPSLMGFVGISIPENEQAFWYQITCFLGIVLSVLYVQFLALDRKGFEQDKLLCSLADLCSAGLALIALILSFVLIRIPDIGPWIKVGCDWVYTSTAVIACFVNACVNYAKNKR